MNNDVNDRTIAAVSARAAASHSRRSSLIGLAGAVVAALAASSPAAAGKGKKKAARRCKKQEIPCQAAVSAMCVRQDIPPDICEDAFFDCCAFFKNCNAAQAFACLQFTE